MIAPDHLSVHVGDSLRGSEEIVEKSGIVPFNEIIIIIIIIILRNCLSGDCH